MYSRHHLALSALIGAALVPVLDGVSPPALVASAAVVGTAIDLDHFAIARLRTGSWAALRRALASPRRALVDQDELFEPGAVGAFTRLLSHLLLGGLLVAALAAVPVTRPFAVAAAVVLWVHLVSDVAWELHRRGERDPGTPPTDRETRT